MGSGLWTREVGEVRRPRGRMGQEAMLLSCGWDGVQVGDLREGGGRTPQWDIPSATKQRILPCRLTRSRLGLGRAWVTAGTLTGKSAWVSDALHLAARGEPDLRAQPPAHLLKPGPTFPQAQLVPRALQGVGPQ